ncbi:NADPH-dependent FMN reductase [Candidatus Colwellia aromaticivorans]|uniref:NADPH-dependent FMN reductase n=1 Tax=Candidatus Colwellia aromaticivorans TaxID=2267621 RepID=UPI000DF1F28E|nr:NAD(P)H-dependent oxidoreductase [Candidatus Colwellia aromaticivorans]
MNLVIISASQRKQSQSVKVAQYIAESVTGYEEVTHFELCQYNLPLWDGDLASKSAELSDWPLLNKQISQADAFIMITPEWSGMASPLLKNVLLMCSGQDTAHKPVLLVGLSGGISGVYPIAELRMNAFKNNKLVAIPDHLVIRNVEEVLNSANESELSDKDSNIRHRIGYSLHVLYHYSEALRALRTNLSIHPYNNEERYSNGM